MIEAFPLEILFQILHNLPPRDIISFSQISIRFRKILVPENDTVNRPIRFPSHLHVFYEQRRAPEDYDELSKFKEIAPTEFHLVISVCDIHTNSFQQLLEACEPGNHNSLKSIHIADGSRAHFERRDGKFEDISLNSALELLPWLTIEYLQVTFAYEKSEEEMYGNIIKALEFAGGIGSTIRIRKTKIVFLPMASQRRHLSRYLEYDTETMNWRHGKYVDIVKSIRAMEHSTTCQYEDCDVELCSKAKNCLAYIRKCHAQHPGRLLCPQCDRYCIILGAHGCICQAQNCLMPVCDRIRLQLHPHYYSEERKSRRERVAEKLRLFIQNQFPLCSFEIGA